MSLLMQNRKVDEDLASGMKKRSSPFYVLIICTIALALCSPCSSSSSRFHMASANSLQYSSSSSSPPDGDSAVLLRVDQSGKGDFKKIQDAIDAIPSNNTLQIFIWIKPGVYREKVVVPAEKPYITLSGTDADTTVILWDEAWETIHSPTLSVLATDFVGRFLTIQNSYGPEAPAVALWVAGDRAAFYSCRFRSFQDTLLDDSGRHFYSSCYIEGRTDFVCGNAASLFEKCHLHSLSNNGGAITAQRRSSEEETSGFSFYRCKITGAGVGTALLGRPWGPYSRVVFAQTYMSNVIMARGWEDWANPDNQKTAYYGENRCFGPGSNASGRVGWSRQLSSREAKPYITRSWINGQVWLRPPPSKFTKPSFLPATSSSIAGGS